MSDTELASNVGKYVDYTPVSGSFTSEGKYNGRSNQNFSTITGLEWRILDANNNKLTLISETAANTNFTLYGANGYNNGVLLLNNACTSMYSNSSLGATGRSLNIDDIEAVSNYNKNNNSNYEGDYIGEYGEEYFPSHRYYPDIFADELTGAPNGTYGTKYGLSNQDRYVTGIASGNSSFKGKWTYYTFTMSTSTMDTQTYVDLLCSSSSTWTWLASRCVAYGVTANGRFDFSMFYVGANIVDANYLYYSNDSSFGLSYAIRPVVEIDLSKVNIGLTGDGGVDTPFSIEAK